MATTELDPLFVKGLRLLHSKSKDSTEQLKQLLDDVIAQSKQSAHSKDRMYTAVKVEGESKIHIKKTSREVPEVASFSSKYSSEDTRDRKADKRQLEKAKQEIAEVEAKIPKLEPPQVYSYYPSSPDLPKLDQYVSKKEDDTDSSDDNADADDFAMEMGLACVICKQLDVTQGNNLVECQECHSLYHQECHRPPATEFDYNDPRRVWYCAKCVKNMKKMATKTQKTVKSSASVAAKEPVTQTKSTRSEGSPTGLLPFKRNESKPTISQANSQTSANKPIGLAGLAANFGGRTTASSSTTSMATATRGSKTTTSGLNIKPLAPFSSTTTAKVSSLTSSSNLLSKISTSSSSFQSLSSSTTSQSSITSTSQKPATTSAPVKGLGLLSAAVASTSTRSASSAAAGNGNSGHKVPSCSPLMSADKRLQIMKKKASKMQERRRLSNK